MKAGAKVKLASLYTTVDLYSSSKHSMSDTSQRAASSDPQVNGSSKDSEIEIARPSPLRHEQWPGKDQICRKVQGPFTVDHFFSHFFESIDPHNVILAMRNLRTCMRSSPAVRGSSFFQTPLRSSSSTTTIAFVKAAIPRMLPV